MKFSHSLQFNAVPEWSSKYIAYSQLKKLVYSLQKEKLYEVGANSDSEHLSQRSPFTKRFIEALDKELKKIDKFFLSQETGILANYKELKDDIEEFQHELLSRRQEDGYGSGLTVVPMERRHTSVSSVSFPFSEREAGYIEREEEEDEDQGGVYSFNRGSMYRSSQEALPLLGRHERSKSQRDAHFEQWMVLKKRLVLIFTQLSELKSYFELNQTGFAKICKKFDKSLETDMKIGYLDRLPDKSHIFEPKTMENINACISQTIGMYAALMNADHIGATLENDSDISNYQDAEKELSMHLREHVMWERNTVWKDMMNLERKAQNVRAQKLQERTSKSSDKRDELKSTQETQGVIQSTECLQWLFNSVQYIKAISSTVAFLVALFALPVRDPLQKNCLAIVLYCSLLWATEAIPLYVTSLLVPLLIVVFPVLRVPGTTTAMTSKEASQFILSSMWSSVIMLLLGGFTLAAALSKYNITKVLSTHALARAGTDQNKILLTIMIIALTVSMLVSNVAAPVLCYSILQPLLRTLPRQSSFTKSLILGVALASNIGGMASPIASPQNIFAIGIMDPSPSWMEWFFITTPVCILSIIGVWLLLLVSFPRDHDLKILKLHAIKEPFTMQQWYVVIVAVLTIVLWCFANKLTPFFGEIGIISIIPMLLLFGTGFLNSDDFNNFMWTIVILAMGGSCMGKAVTSSGLLDAIANSMKSQLENCPLLVIILTFGILILVMATFVSHTVAAMIFVPLMQEIGQKLPGTPHSRMLIMLTCLLCSAAMGLPTSGFPNVTAISMIDEIGERYLDVGTFIKRGVPASILTYVIIVTVGFVLMRFCGY